MKKIKIGFALLAVVILTTACSKRENINEDIDAKLNIISSLKGNETSATIDHLQGIINLVLPPRSNITDVTLTIETSEGITTTPENGSVLDLTNTIDIISNFGNNTREYQMFTKVLPNQIAFLGEADNFTDLLATADDDVVVAAQWLKDTYPLDFIYVDVKNVTYQDLENINVVMFYYDQVGTSDLPTAFTNGNAKSAFIQYLVNGGKMLLGGMATSYAETIGRDNSSLLTIQGNGAGFDDPAAIWGIDGGVNFQNSQLNHPIYTFNPGEITFDGNGYVPLLDGGYREDHNNLWDLASLLEPGHQLGQFAEFYRLYGGKVLAEWSGVTDECCPGIIEFEPKEPYSGTIIAIGVGAMEWNTNDNRTNVYEDNIKAIYKNSIDYLATK